MGPEIDIKLRNSGKILEMAKSCPYHVLRSGIEVFGNMIFLFFSDIFDPFLTKMGRFENKYDNYEWAWTFCFFD